MVLVTAYSVRFAVICNIHHNKKVCSADGFFDIAFSFSGAEAYTFTFYKEGWFAVSLRNDLRFFLGNQLFTEFYKFLVNLLCKILATGKGCNTNRRNRKGFFK